MKEVFHMGIYAEKRKSHLNSSDVKSAVAQSAMPAADYMSPLGGAASPELGDSLRSRIQQNFLDNQNTQTQRQSRTPTPSVQAHIPPARTYISTRASTRPSQRMNWCIPSSRDRCPLTARPCPYRAAMCRCSRGAGKRAARRKRSLGRRCLI